MVSSTLVVLFSVLPLVSSTYISIDQKVLSSSNAPYGNVSPASSVLRRFVTTSEDEREELLEAAFVSKFYTIALR